MDDFIWIDHNTWKVANHGLTEAEVEFAWRGGTVIYRGNHPVNGPYSETVGMCPNGRPIRMTWRYDVDWDGETKVFVITAY